MATTMTVPEVAPTADTRLYTYIVPHDGGTAPSPYGGVCTLAICKPMIRRTAEVGDWVAGLGSVPHGSAGKLIYAMRITDKMTMQQYDRYTARELPAKVSTQGAGSTGEFGDSIYDFATNPPRVRPGRHNHTANGNMKKDLGGSHVLLSEEFYYFGQCSKPLPPALRPLIKQGPGHQVDLNTPYVADFVAWLRNLGFEPNKVHCRPELA